MGDNNFVYSNTSFTYNSTPCYVTTNATTSDWCVATNTTTSDWVTYNAPFSDEELRILDELTAPQINGYFQGCAERYEYIRRSCSKDGCSDEDKKIKPLELGYNDLMQFD